jgi:hypothetical protein
MQDLDPDGVGRSNPMPDRLGDSVALGEDGDSDLGRLGRSAEGR